MTEAEFEKVKVGTRMVYTDAESDDCGDQGTVTEKGYCAVRIEWDDGLVTMDKPDSGASSIHIAERN